MTYCDCGAPGYIRSATYQLPLCDACYQVRIGRGLEGEPDPAFDVPATEPGALGWDFRPPEVVGREGCDLEIEIGGRLRYQQRPPTHVPGSGYRQPVVRTVPREVSEREAARRVEAGIAALPPAQADVVRLRLLGLSCADIAERLGIRVVTVYERLRRAKG